jgi:hypothetical protein
MKTATIQWAPKVRPERIWQLYHREPQGLLDDDVVNEVAWALYQRCESILMVTEGHRLPCPACTTQIVCPTERWSRTTPIICSACGWMATYGQYRDSWRHQDLRAGNALYAFQTYVDTYRHAASSRERMLLIDQLLHAFHWSLKRNRPHGPAAVQLLAGDKETICAFLDKLTYGSTAKPPGTEESRTQDGREHVHQQHLEQSAVGRRAHAGQTTSTNDEAPPDADHVVPLL